MAYTSGLFLNNQVGVKLASTGTSYVDLSDHVQKVDMKRSFQELNVNAMGDTSVKAVAGLSSATVTIDFLNDRGTASVLATIQTTYGTTANIKWIQNTVDPVSATNPLYTSSVLVNGISDVSGATADEAIISVTWNCNSVVTVATTGTW